MENTTDTPQVSSEFKNALIESQATAREQIAAAWQLHIDRVREELETGWRDQVDLIFQERFAEIEARLHQEFERAVEERSHANLSSRLDEHRATTQRQLTDLLNQAARRLRNSEGREAWISTLLEVAGNFCGRAALFQVNGANLKFEGGLGIGEDREAEFPIASAPAFSNAIESKDTVVAAGTRGELSDAAVDLFGGNEDQKVYLFPLVLRRETVGVLYAEPGEDALNVSALELITALAVESIIEDEVTTMPGPPDLTGITGIKLPPPNIANTQWTLLPKADQEVHLRGQRFARSQVAQLLLYKVEKVRAGRAAKNLYGNLKEEIDAGRDAFRSQFISASPSMVDYYHLELVGTLAQNDNTLLGPDYPGPLP